jgi:hypothetical protein
MLNFKAELILSQATEIINVIKDVFGKEELPICVVVLDSEGLELFSTANCTMDDTNILGIMAYEQMNEQMKSRLDNDIDLMIFRINQITFFVAPIIEDLFLLARSDITKLGHITPLLDGLRSQIAFRITQLK